MRARLLLVIPLAGCVIDVVRQDDVGDAERCEAAEFWPHAFADREDALFELINDARGMGGMCGEEAKNPVTQVALAPALRCAARLHAVDLATMQQLSHEGSDGSGTVDRVDAALYEDVPTAELLAADFTDAELALEAWLDSPEHCQEIHRARTDEIGVGYGENEDGSATGWVVLFGELRREE